MFIHTLVLSVLQSITEFLPVSSSGHLILLPFILGWQDQGVALDIALHIGTLLAVCVYFARDLWTMFIGLFTGGNSRKTALLLIVATLPILVLGLFAGNCIEQVFRSPYIVAVMLIVFGVILWLADRYNKADKNISQMTYKDALLIGIAQCLALIPGTSRSGITMTSARCCRLNRSDAAKFSMLLSIPAIGAAGGWLLLKLVLNHQMRVLNEVFLQGVLFSFAGGLIVIWFLMGFVKKHSFFAFMIYRVLLGAILLSFLILG